MLATTIAKKRCEEIAAKNQSKKSFLAAFIK
jgi:hypothetical protein